MMPNEDEPLEPELREAARAYHQPPEPPREQMWAEIAAHRTANAGLRGRRLGPVLPWLGGIAAVLAMGVAIGRFTARQPAPPDQTPTTARVPAVTPKEDAAAYRLAAAEHLGQTEAFLTLFRASVRQHQQDQLASPTARQLLATNRLLLDSPAAGDPKLRLLLQDLELVLAQIAQLGPSRRSEDLQFITNDLEDGMLVRLRAAVPAGAVVTSRQGAL